MIIVVPLVGSVDGFEDSESCYPTLSAARPDSCPGCGQASRPLNGRFGVVGHGSYWRQVLGAVADRAGTLVRIRRFRCRGCKKTISVLPDLLHPRRWYGAWVLLEALVLQLVARLSVKKIEYRLRRRVSAGGWRSLRRWRAELLAGLWTERARELGARGGATTQGEARRRLGRLVSLVGVELRPGGGARAAPLLSRGWTHDSGQSWRRGSARPEPVAGDPRRESVDGVHRE